MLLDMWNIQYERVKRWLSRIENVSNPNYQMAPIDAMDYIVCFFQNCWHLKDWLLNDPSVSKDPRLRKTIKDFAEKKSHYIKISQNIANGSKHLIFENRRRRSMGLSGRIIGEKQLGIWHPQLMNIRKEIKLTRLLILHGNVLKNGINS